MAGSLWSLFLLYGSSLLGQYQLTTLYGDLLTGITIHADLPYFTIQQILDVVSHHFFARVCNRAAALLRSGIGIGVLHVLLGFVTYVTSTHSPGDSSKLLAITPTDLITQQTTDYSTDGSSGNLMLILYRPAMCNRYILTDFTGRFDRFLDRLDGYDLSELWTSI